MGNILCCDTCPTNVTSSVVNLSEAIVNRIADGTKQRPTKSECPSYEDCAWFDKIKCIDDSHSNQYGLTAKELEKIITGFEKRLLRDGITPNLCFIKKVLGCYQNNLNCSLRCSIDKTDYIDCLEVNRLEKVRAYAEEYYKNKYEKKEKKCGEHEAKQY